MKRATWTVVSSACLGIMLAGSPFLESCFNPLTVWAQAIPAAVQQGYSLLGRGRVDEAIAAFQRAVQQYPQSAVARLGLAIAYRRVGQDENAFQAYEQVLRLDPNNQLALRSIGLLAYRPERQARGIEALTTLLRLNPGDIEARAQRAELYRYQGRIAESLSEYLALLQQNASPQILLGTAEAYAANSNYQQALELFNRYRQTGKAISGYSAISYARTLRNTGSPQEAIQILESQLSKLATAKQPDIELIFQTRAELSQSYLATGQNVRALAILDPLRDRPEGRLPLARSLNEIGRRTNVRALREQAVQLYRQELSQSFNPSPSLLEEVADVLIAFPEQRSYSLQLYRQLSQQQPGDRGIQLKRLALERQLGLISRAQLRESVRALLQGLPTDPVQQRSIAQGLARIEPEAEFLPIYQALLQNPLVNEPFLNFRIAQILLQRNDLRGARNALAAYTASPQTAGDLTPQLLAAEIERREGNLDAAARRYEAIIAANPSDIDILIGAFESLANVRNTQGRTGEALVLYDQLIARFPQELRLQLARASVAYQAQVISAAAAEAVLNTWIATQPPTSTPPELFGLVGVLPVNPRLEPLYLLLAQEDPENIPVQLRLVQVLALRDPALARARVLQLVARSQVSGIPTVESYLLQGQLALAIADVNLAETSFRSALVLQPYNSDALVGLGDVRFQQRQFDQAEQLYNQALAFKPNDISIKKTLIDLKVAQDYRLEALYQIDQLQPQQYGQFPAPDLMIRRQQIGESFLTRRGFQPPWERY